MVEGEGSVVTVTPAPPPIRVFLLDDHELLRRGLRDLLDNVPDIEVIGESGTARQGTAQILALRPDVALLDVQLPDGSGVEVCRSVRSRDPAIRVLMLTTYDDAQARLAAVLAGAAGFVLKQIRGAALVDAIRQVHTGEALAHQDGGAEDDVPAPPGAEDARLRTLTPRERRILALVVEGLTNGEIGERLGIGEKTVRNHVSAVLGKLGLTRRTQAAVYAVQHDVRAVGDREA